MWYVWLIVGIVIGSLISVAIFFMEHKHLTAGTFKIDHSNPEKDVYRLDFDNLDLLSNRKQVIIKIDNNADLSQK